MRAALACVPPAGAPARRRRCSPIEIVGDAIPASLTGAAGRCRRAAARSSPTARSGFACCATPGRFPEERFQGISRRTSKGAGARWSEGQLRLRIVDASRLNPDTIMPPYYRIDGLAARRAGLPRQADPDRGADRGRGGVSRNAAGVANGRDNDARTRQAMAADPPRGATSCGVAGALAVGGAAADHRRCAGRAATPDGDAGGDPPRSIGEAPSVKAGKVKLDIPPLVENGNAVP